jgi:hypothetical protein
LELVISSMLVMVVIVAAPIQILGQRADAPQARIELTQTGDPARVDNPDCSTTTGGMTAGDLVLIVGAAAIDAYVGSPVALPMLKVADRGQLDWLKVRLGLHDGKSTCATQCVVIPASLPSPEIQACMSESGGDGLECTNTARRYPFGAMENFTIATTSGGARVACVLGKNWSHNRNRWFYVQAGPASAVASHVDALRNVADAKKKQDEERSSNSSPGELRGGGGAGR